MENEKKPSILTNISDRFKFGFLGKVYQVKPPDKQEVPYIDAEFAVDETAIYKRLKLVPYTPDDLLTKKGFPILQKMLFDPEIEGAVDSLLRVRLSSGWEVNAGNDDDVSIEQRDFVEWNLDNIEGSFDDDLREIMNAVPLGWSLCELVWYEITSGRFAGKIGLRAIKSRNPKYFNLWTDDFDNVRDYGVVNISSFGYGEGYPREKFIIYAWQKQYENIFGKSAIRSLYDYWFLKQVFTRAWGIYMEKFGHPFPIVKYPQGMDDTSRGNILQMIRQIRMETGLMIPDSCEFELQSAMASGTSDPFSSAMDWFNTQIRKRILGQDLTGESGNKSGSYSLGQVHFDILLMFEEQLGIDLANKAVNPQIIHRLIDINYRNTTDYPEFRFKPLIQDDREAIIKTYFAGVQANIIKPIPEDEKVIREYLHLPSRNTDAPVEQTATAKAPTATKPEAIPEATKEKEFEYKEFADQIITGVPKRALTKFEESVDFAEIKMTMEHEVASGSLVVAKLIQDSVKDLISQIDKKKIITEKNLSEIDKLNLKYTGDIKAEFEKILLEAYKKGMRDGRRELTTKKKALKFKEFSCFADYREVKPSQAIDYFKQKAFYMAGVERDNVLKKVKSVLLNGLKQGSTQKEVINEIDNAMTEYIAKSGSAESEIADEITGARIETIVRTNYADALTQGRKMFFESPELDGYVVAYQYSAIMDDRVRPNHACCDGKFFSINSPVWKELTPPNGFNCRCMIVPITTDDDWSEDTKGACCKADVGFSKVGGKE